MERLVHAENTTFRVHSDSADFCLRISRPGYQSSANIRSEIGLLAALSEEGFHVPRPFQPRLISASTDSVPEARDCVLFHWIEGEIYRKEGLSPEQAAKVGVLMARLHGFVEGWQEPPGFDRRTLTTWLFDPEEPMAIDEPSFMAAEEDRLDLVEVVRDSRALARELPRDSTWHRLIHSDLHHGNVVFSHGEPYAIDFDDTGYGFLLYDMAASLCVRTADADYADYQAAFLGGYASIRELPPGTAELLPAFLRLRLATICDWVISRTDNPEFREIAPGWVGKMCERMRAVRD